MGSHSLVLNASFEPIHIVSWQRAIQLLYAGKVEVVEDSAREVRTVSVSLKIPAVLRLKSYVQLKKRRQFIRFSRSNVFIRDKYICQYCDKKHPKAHLTLDHVVPVVQGGSKIWTNIVTACKGCNQKKGGRTPDQAKMKLRRKPSIPTWLPANTLKVGVTFLPDSWKIYFQYIQAQPDD